MTDSTNQFWNPERYAANARFVSELGVPVLELLAPQPGERILDLGCGDGALTLKLKELGCDVLGVDASVKMVEAARKLGLDAQVVDGRTLPFTAEFDAVFSNAALHWMKKQEAAIAGVWQSLKPGGRFVGELGAHGNVQAIVCALEQALGARGFAVANPWFFPSSDEYRALLEGQGFEVDAITSFVRPTPLPGNVGGWLQTFGHPYLQDLAEDEKANIINMVVEVLRPKLCDANGTWQADYIRLRFRARKPA